MVTEKKELCEACEKQDVFYILKDVFPVKKRYNKPEKDYKVCANCLVKLVNISLSKQEFRNLIRNGHSVEEFHLHGDFYDPKTGDALQPNM